MTSHYGFIVAAYAVTAAVLLGLVVWVIADGRAQKAALAELDTRRTRPSDTRT